MAQPASKETQTAEQGLRSSSLQEDRGRKMGGRCNQLGHKFHLRVKPLLSVSFSLFSGILTLSYSSTTWLFHLAL